MRIEVRDARLEPVETHEGYYETGIVLLINGEPGDKHPHLSICIGEDSLPNLRVLWEQGKVADLLIAFKDEGWQERTIKAWELMLTMQNALGTLCRAKDAL